LITKEEAKHTSEFEDYFVIEPEFNFWRADGAKKGKRPSEDFYYSSDNNSWHLTKDELKKVLHKNGFL